MILKEYKVLNIKTGKVIVMNDNSINALKKHNLWHGFDILEQPKKIDIPVVNEFVDTSNIVITNVDESIVDESQIEQPEKPKRKNKKS